MLFFEFELTARGASSFFCTTVIIGIVETIKGGMDDSMDPIGMVNDACWDPSSTSDTGHDQIKSYRIKKFKNLNVFFFNYFKKWSTTPHNY